MTIAALLQWTTRSVRREVATVFACAFTWLALLAGLRPLNLPDEGRYVGVAWEMAVNRLWLVPTLNGLPFFHKPPLFYWLTAGAIRLLGPSLWSARAAPLLAGAAAIAVVFAVLREWADRRTARLAATVLATMPLFYAGSQFGNMDLLVAACISVSILLSASAAERLEAGAPWRGALGGAYVAAGLGVLAKGLIGAVLPGLVVFVWLASLGRWRTLRRLFWSVGLLLFALTVMPWILVMQRTYPDFLHYFIVVQHFRRFTGTGFNNVVPFWFYVPVLGVLTLPWLPWLFVRRRSAGAAARVHVVPTRLMWIWMIVIGGFFSIPHSKLIGYIIPCSVPLAVLIATASVPHLQAGHRAVRLWMATGLLAALACVSLVVTVALTHPASSRGLAAALKQHRSAGEGIAFLDDYWYDIGFYLRERGPVTVVTQWRSPQIEHSDDWRNELLDAAAFDPVDAQARLVDSDRLRALLCSGQIKWLVVHQADRSRYPFLQSAPLVAEERVGAVLHADVADPVLANGLGCASFGSPNR